MEKDISVAFLGALVPDEQEYHNPAFRRSGILVQDGIINGLCKQKIKHIVYSLRPVPSYPNEKRVLFGRKSIHYKNQSNLVLLPFINILIIKSITYTFSLFFELIKWSISNRRKRRIILVYNAYSPPLPFVYWIGKLTRSKSVAILYDLGIPPKQLKLSPIKKGIYWFVEFFAKRYIPRLDGRIVINENIAKTYGQNNHSLLIDGGISNEVISRLFELKTNVNRVATRFLIAGSISPINGTRLVGEMLEINNNPNIRIIFAGNGRDVDFVKYIASKDSRVIYKGMLTLNELFNLYKEVDVLMNLRVNSEENENLFPSKILEYLTVGKFILSTNVGHLDKEYGKFCKILYNPTAENLSNAINEIHTIPDVELIKNGINSREYMLNTHTWEKQTEKIVEYINSKC